MPSILRSEELNFALILKVSLKTTNYYPNSSQQDYSSVLNNRPVTLGPDSLLSFNTGKGEVDIGA